MIRRCVFVACLTLACCWLGFSRAEEPAAGVPPNWQLPTLGGTQYWADEQICGPYRIQRNASTGHYRLLDGADERLAWGTYAQCAAKLAEIRTAKPVRPYTKRVVLVLHGMGRSRHSMDEIAEYLRKHGTNDVIQIGYPSTREAVPDHACSLDRIVRRLEGVEQIDVVAYSMGNLVTRYWLGDIAASTDAAGGAPPPSVPKLHRYVMLGPPNHGAQRANLWAASTVGRELFNLVVGDGGQQLGPRFHEIKDHLAVPACEFGIIAGGKGDGQGWHDGIDGDDDGTVGVAETKLAGAADFTILPVRHMVLLTDKRVHEMTARFLQHGYFTTAAARQPLEQP